MTDDWHSRPVIDVHVHFGPDEASFMAQAMAENHLSRLVNLGSLEALDVPFEHGMAAFRIVLGARMAYFAAPDFSDTKLGFGERMAEELAWKVAAGARGLKVFKELGLRHRDSDGRLISVDDERLDPLWAKAGELAVPVLIHVADPAAFFEPLDERNERCEELQVHPDWHFGAREFPRHDALLAERNRVIERHPGTIFIGAHLGNYPENLAYVDLCLDRYRNLFVDTSARIGEIGRHPAEEARAFFEKHQDRILFGSDLVRGWRGPEDVAAQGADLARIHRFYEAHWRFFESDEQQIAHPGFPIQGRWRVDGLGLPAGVLDKLYVDNAKRLIPAP